MADENKSVPYAGLTPARQNALITVPEATFLVPNPLGVPVFRTDVGMDGGGVSNPQTWVEQIADGRNLAESAAMVGESGVISRPFMPRYRLLPSVLRTVMGLPVADTAVDANTRDYLRFVDPEQGAPAIETFTAYHGLPTDAKRLTGCKTASISWDVNRSTDGGSVGGTWDIDANRFEEGVYVPGASAHNALHAFILSTAPGMLAAANATFAVSVDGDAPVNVVLTAAMTQAQIKAAFETALPAATVTVSPKLPAEWGNESSFTVGFNAPANTVVTIEKTAGNGWTTYPRAFGDDGAGLYEATGSFLLPQHALLYLAPDEDELAAIDWNDLPDHIGRGGDEHLLKSSTRSTFQMADLWAGYYGIDGKLFATDMRPGARTTTFGLTLPPKSAGAIYLRNTEKGCQGRGFFLVRRFLCGGFEVRQTAFVGRNDAIGFEVEDDLDKRAFNLTRRRNPEGNVPSHQVEIWLPKIV